MDTKRGMTFSNGVAAVLRVSLKRPGDVMARYGGEEFVAILPETNTEGAVQIAEDLRSWTEMLGIPHAYSQAAETVTISLGVSTLIPMQGLMPKHLILAADNALYESKRQGRNRVSVMAADAEKTGKRGHFVSFAQSGPGLQTGGACVAPPLLFPSMERE